MILNPFPAQAFVPLVKISSKNRLVSLSTSLSLPPSHAFDSPLLSPLSLSPSSLSFSRIPPPISLSLPPFPLPPPHPHFPRLYARSDTSSGDSPSQPAQKRKALASEGLGGCTQISTNISLGAHSVPCACANPAHGNPVCIVSQGKDPY